MARQYPCISSTAVAHASTKGARKDSTMTCVAQTTETSPTQPSLCTLRRAFLLLATLRPFVVVSRVMTLHGVLPYIQIVLSVLLITCILLQQTGASMGGAFGGDNFSAAFHTRRGFEKLLFRASIVIGILFAATAFITLVI